MCGGIIGGNSAPPSVVERDPQAEADAAAAEAARKANAEAATNKKRKRGQSLLTSGAAGDSTGSKSLLGE